MNRVIARVLTSALTCFILYSGIFISAHASPAPELVNGSLSGTVSTETSIGDAPPGWVVAHGTPEVAGDGSPTNNTGAPWLPSPDGGTFGKLNGTVDPVYREAIAQTIDGFTVGQTYELHYYRTNLGFYYALIDQWNATDGYLEFYLDDELLHSSPITQAPANFDDPIQWSAGSISFVATDTTHTLTIWGRSTLLEPNSSASRTSTAYMAVDGIAFTAEDCGNGIDDDLDGLIDDDDEDCQEVLPPVGLLVRCIHRPLWPEEGEQVFIRAETIDAEGNEVVADRIEIYTRDQNNLIGGASGNVAVERSTFASGSRMRYGCRAERGSEATFSGWRELDIGTPEFTDIRAVPVIYNGPMDKKIDIIFVPEANRHGVGAGGRERFMDDIYEVILDGVYGIPWFVANQREINFWLGRDLGTVTPSNPNDSSKKCKKEKPDGFKKGYGFGDATGIIHAQPCRDNASLKVFTTRFNTNRLQVVAHEIGHAAFTLSDEYVGASSLYFTLPDVPNLLPTSSKCRSAASDRGFDPDACRSLVADGASGFFLGGFWIFEPDYTDDLEPWNEVRDLMQQTGGEGECVSNSTGDPVACTARYRVGDSEIYRMNWKVDKCRAGRC